MSLLALIMALSPGLAAGHAALVGSDPGNGAVRERPPERVPTRYSQELETRQSTLQVFDAGGRQVDVGDGGVDLDDPDHASMTVTLRGPLPAGSYRVRWKAVSTEDGDTTEGEFTFRVGSGVPMVSRSPLTARTPVVSVGAR